MIAQRKTAEPYGPSILRTKFNIAGVATCPMSGNCGQQSLQLRRLSNKQLHTYARYHTTPPATHGLLNQGIIA